MAKASLGLDSASFLNAGAAGACQHTLQSLPLSRQPHCQAYLVLCSRRPVLSFTQPPPRCPGCPTIWPRLPQGATSQSSSCLLLGRETLLSPGSLMHQHESVAISTQVLNGLCSEDVMCDPHQHKTSNASQTRRRQYSKEPGRPRVSSGPHHLLALSSWASHIILVPHSLCVKSGCPF